jgi:RHS repeat-associated protein
MVDYLVADSLGSVRGVVTSSGSLAASVDYGAWDNPETTGGPSCYTPFGFTGAYTDSTGMAYLIGRYYDPATGQFLSVDPMVGRTGEPYAYAYDSPVNEKDPSGLKACEANEPGGKRCPYIRIHTTPEESGSGPTLYTIHVVVLNLTTIWPNGTVGTAYVNYHGVVATGPIDQWHDFGLAVLAHQSNGGEANYYETMVCNNYLSINVYLMKRHRGPAGPWVLNTNSAAYRSEPLFVGCEPIIELL